MEDNAERINDFYNYMLEKHTAIESVDVDGSNSTKRMFQKLLYATYIDSMSACIYPKKRNKVRFIQLLERFSSWKEKDHVSLNHLSKLVSVPPDPELEGLRLYVNKKLEGWKDRDFVPINEDPKFGEILKVGCSKGSTTGSELQLKDFKHSNLLYQIRNSLVHQFQMRNVEIGTDYRPPSPYYEYVTILGSNLETESRRIELVYPVEFFKDLSGQILSEVIEYLKIGNINPFPSYYSGDYLISGLNQK